MTMYLVTEGASDREFWDAVFRDEPFGPAVRVVGDSGKHNTISTARTALVARPGSLVVFAFDADTADPASAAEQQRDFSLLMDMVRPQEQWLVAMFVPDRERALAELAPPEEREVAGRDPKAWVEARVKAGRVEPFKQHPVVQEVLEFFRAASGQADAA